MFSNPARSKEAWRWTENVCRCFLAEREVRIIAPEDHTERL